MQVWPKLKKGFFFLISFIFPVKIENRTSPHNRSITVSYFMGRYQLSTDHAIYSFEDLYTAFSRSFKKINIHHYPIKSVLILGFGLGSIPYILKKKYHINCNYIGVEIDPDIIELAQKYNPFIFDKNLKVVCGDASEFIMNCETKLDLICIDLFRDDIVPEKFEQEVFLQKIKQLLNPNGILLYNRLANEPHITYTNDFFNVVFKKIFENAQIITIERNYVFFYEMK